MISIPKTIPGFLTKTLVLSVGAASTLLATTHAQPLGSVFVIEMENRNWSQPSTDTSAPSQILGNAAAPYINSLVTPGNANAAQTAYCSAYHNVLATPTGANPSIHPSEPNYIWQEAGSNLGVANDNDPYGSGKTVASIQAYLTANPNVSGENFSGLLQSAGVSWKSYQEDTDLATLGSTYPNGNQAAYTGTLGSNQLTNTPVSPSQFTVPLTSFSGTSTNYTNAYNGSHQYNFATKHDGTLFFPATNGGNDASSANTFASRYAPLQQLSTDLTNNAVARYNLITPNQYNDMHTALSGGYTYNGTHYTGDLAQVAQGDNFLAILIPQIMASAAYQNNGAIVIWLDETEGTNQNDFKHTLMEIVISPSAKGNAYNSTFNYTHSSDVNTFQKVFGVTASTPSGFLNDAANPSQPNADGITGSAYDLSDLFVAGTLPANLPGLSISQGGMSVNRRLGRMVQTVTITNVLNTPVNGPINLVIDNLSANTALANSTGVTVNNPPTGSPYLSVASGTLAPGASVSATLQFAIPSSGYITYTARTVSGPANP